MPSTRLPRPARDPAVVLAERLRDQHLLVVLDNVEHLVEAAPQIAAVIEAAPGLTVLATSRAPLRVRGEVEVGVDPLGLPDGGAPERLARRTPADRARTIRQPRVGEWAAGRRRGRGDLRAARRDPARASSSQPRAAACSIRWSCTTGSTTALLDGRPRPPGTTADDARDARLELRTARSRRSRPCCGCSSVFVGGFRLDDLEQVGRAGGPGATTCCRVLEALAEQSLVVGAATASGRRLPAARADRAVRRGHGSTRPASGRP